MKEKTSLFHRNNWIFWGIFLALLFIFLALAYKNPFSDNSLISNLEPYPDTLLYSLPAWNWSRGLGFTMSAYGVAVVHTVPMTYSYILAPFMKMFNDVRGFYYANIFLAIVSLVFFWLIVKRLFGKEKFGWVIVGFLGFLLVTNFYFFNNPVLAMAENLVLPLIVIYFYFYIQKISIRNFIFLLVLAVVMARVKNTSLVLGGIFGILLLAKFIVEVIWPNRKWKKYTILITLAGGLIASYLYLPRILKLSGNSFNIKFFKTNWAFYWNCLTGGPTRNLWYFQKTMTIDMFMLSALGGIVGLIVKKTRFLISSIWVTILIFVGAMSFFVDTEGRHVMVLIPLFLISAGFGLALMAVRIKKYFWLVIFLLLALNLRLSYEPEGKLSKIVSLKQQVGMNFRHREVPWNYVCIDEFNSYFKNKDDNAYLGSFLPLYMFYYFGNNNYQTLPLSVGQDFMPRGMRSYYPPPLRNIFLNKLDEGKNVYFSDYYSTNGREAWKNELAVITQGLRVEKVFQSPEDVCNIYQLDKMK